MPGRARGVRRPHRSFFATSVAQPRRILRRALRPPTVEQVYRLALISRRAQAALNRIP